MGRFEEFNALRQQGMTHQEIAAACGVSRQRVAQVLAQRTEGHFRPYKPEECVYDGLRKWLNENLISRSDINRILHGEPYVGGHQHERICGRLRGKTTFMMREVDLLLDASGKTYEELFRSGRWCEDGQRATKKAPR
jgi:transcriptional regulator with XRE-family HTH domain